MKRRFLALILAAMLCVTLSACNQNQNPVESSPEQTTTGENAALENEQEQTFPFEDDESRTRYRLVINGNEVSTDNLPFTYPDSPKCGYYPLEDVLAHIEIACFCSEDKSALTTKINGSVLKVTAGVAEMTYGRKSIKAVGTETAVCIDGCLYVPSFLFLSIFDNGIVDFSSDRSAATLDTNTTIDLAASGTAGLSVPSAGTSGVVSAGNGQGSSGGSTGSSNCGTCNGSGRSICTYCSGTGSKIEYQQAYDPVSKQYKQTQRTVFCSRCGGSGQVICPSCGGSGKR
ncbi:MULTISPECIES: hypothetical protein [Dehalobacter]|nr:MULTISPECIES: hypothetical protein [Dehalobacter]MDJ0304879.1 hypothetical protein [Dehalobacter sp.]